MDTTLQNWENRIGRRLRLRDLHILFAVVQWGSMAQAARHLAMTQPAVSESIANLEDALRVRLLDRSSRGIEPTIYAHALLKRGRVVFDELRQGIQDIEFLANPTVGEVRVACSDYRATILDSLSVSSMQARRRNFGSCESEGSTWCWQEWLGLLSTTTSTSRFFSTIRIASWWEREAGGRPVARLRLQSW
jgi:molybdenum-dependent DNA-binding transcriptional regulator ModE